MGSIEAKVSYQVLAGNWLLGIRRLKDQAIDLAIQHPGSYLKDPGTGLTIRLLPNLKTDCQVCGNELNGKKHCSSCGQFHVYL